MGPSYDHHRHHQNPPFLFYQDFSYYYVESIHLTLYTIYRMRVYNIKIMFINIEIYFDCLSE